VPGFPEIVGHRGAPRDRLENTLASFEQALDLGADALELDVHATRDGVVVVHHDAALSSGIEQADLADLTIESLSWSELREIEIGPGATVPRLEDVLALAARRATVYVEIKGARIETLVVRDITRSSATCAVHAFDHRVAGRVSALAPTLPTGVLVVGRLVQPAAALRAAGARDYWQHHAEIDPELVAEVHGAGGRVVAWTVNDGAEGAALAAMGVDALCTDLPGAMRAAVAER
jgi:glycerophosphoryl diester phosphodiesterase